MLHRALLDPTPPADADIDTAAMAEAAAAVERGERRLRLLAELTEIGLRLAKRLAELAEVRIERELKDGAPGAPRTPPPLTTR